MIFGISRYAEIDLDKRVGEIRSWSLKLFNADAANFTDIWQFHCTETAYVLLREIAHSRDFMEKSVEPRYGSPRLGLR